MYLFVLFDTVLAPGGPNWKLEHLYAEALSKPVTMLLFLPWKVHVLCE